MDLLPATSASVIRHLQALGYQDVSGEIVQGFVDELNMMMTGQGQEAEKQKPQRRSTRSTQRSTQFSENLASEMAHQQGSQIGHSSEHPYHTGNENYEAVSSQLGSTRYGQGFIDRERSNRVPDQPTSFTVQTNPIGWQSQQADIKQNNTLDSYKDTKPEAISVDPKSTYAQKYSSESTVKPTVRSSITGKSKASRDIKNRSDEHSHQTSNRHNKEKSIEIRSQEANLRRSYLIDEAQVKRQLVELGYDISTIPLSVIDEFVRELQEMLQGPTYEDSTPVPRSQQFSSIIPEHKAEQASNDQVRDFSSRYENAVQSNGSLDYVEALRKDLPNAISQDGMNGVSGQFENRSNISPYRQLSHGHDANTHMQYDGDYGANRSPDVDPNILARNEGSRIYSQNLSINRPERRPQTAIAQYVPPKLVRKRHDPVARYHALQKHWAGDEFLRRLQNLPGSGVTSTKSTVYIGYEQETRHQTDRKSYQAKVSV